MRAGQLRSLIRELRAGGVSEYSDGVVTLKLSPQPAERVTTPAKATGKDATAEARRLEQMAQDLGAPVEELRRVADLVA